MSTPRFLELPPGVRRKDVRTPLGTVATLWAVPTVGSCELQPALLVPGFTGSKEDFLALLQTLAQAGRVVVAMDMPGQYQSPGFDSPDGYTLSGLGRSVTALLDALDVGPVHLLGHSLGGLVTRETVLDGETTLLSYTVMDSGPAGVGGNGAKDAHALLAALGDTPTRERVRWIWEHRMDVPARTGGVPADVRAFLRERLLGNDPVGLARMAGEVVSAPDRTAELAARDVPTLVLYGEDDAMWPADVQDTMARRLGASRVVIPGAAHSPNVEAPETTAAALTEFWNKAEAPATATEAL